MRKPDFFIVGAPKSGTSAMNQYLGGHPDIYMAKKEMHFFGADLHFGSRFYRRGLAPYLEEFAACNGQHQAGEASVWYLFSTQAAAEIQAFNPDSRIIIILREPVELLHSMYCQFCFDANEHLPTFEQALAAENDRRAGRRITRRTYLAQGLAYHDIVRYTEQVRRYLDRFGRERVQVIIYDEFAADVAAAYRSTLAFLGVDAQGPEPDFKVVNGNKSERSAVLQHILSEPLLRSTVVAIGRRLPRPIFKALASAEVQLWRLNTRPEKRPPLAPDLCAQLKREFAPEVERLSQLLGRDLTYWSKPPAAARATEAYGQLLEPVATGA